MSDKGRMVYNTGLEVKLSALPLFYERIKEQIIKGGEKYEIGEGREATDLMMEADPRWIMATIIKYAVRYLHSEHEEDLFKIATYAMLQWIKSGYHNQEINRRELENVLGKEMTVISYSKAEEPTNEQSYTIPSDS